MHEDYDYYTNCKYRNRNKGLFTADQVWLVFVVVVHNAYFNDSQSLAQFNLNKNVTSGTHRKSFLVHVN